MSFIDLFPFISLQVVILVVVMNTILLKTKGIRVSNKSKKSRTYKFIVHPLFLLIFLLLIFEISKPIFPISILPDVVSLPVFYFKFLEITGVCITSFSLLLFVFTLYCFGKSFRFGMNSENKGELKTSGIFKFSRNPFFLSILLFFTGLSLIIPSPFFITITVVTIVSIHFFILKEEWFMNKNYGEEYKSYCRKTRRYL